MKVFYSHYLTQLNHPAVQMVEHVSRELRTFGHDVYVHASAGIEPESQAEAPPTSDAGDANVKTTKVAQFKKSLKRNLWFAKAMYRNRRWYPGDLQALREFQPDIVLARQDAYCWSVVKAARKLNIPVVTYADAPVAYEVRMFNEAMRWHPPGLVEYIERWGIGRSRSVITVSHPAARQLQRYRVKCPIYVDHNGIDERRFPEFNAEHREAIRKSLGLRARTVLGFQGSFRSFHGIDRLAELIEMTDELDVDWLLIGDGPERRKLEAASAGRDNVKFLGRRPQEEMAALLSAIDIAVAPHAKMDGDFYFCPLKILEYAASGCAILASNQGDIPKLLAYGAGGEIVDSDDPRDWMCGIIRLISDPAYRSELGQIARSHVMQNLTWRRTAESVESILQRALGKSRKSSESLKVESEQSDSANDDRIEDELMQTLQDAVSSPEPEVNEPVTAWR
ncbi:MAG: glycosyltransferase family 4 protein [Planctomycetota bacterium]